MQIDLPILKLGLIFFWSLWLTLTFITNLFDALKAWRVLPEEWRFASGNYAAVAKTTAVYSLPEWLTGLLFLGVTIWEGLSSALFWVALGSYLRLGASDLRNVDTAFALSLGLWAALIVADEIFKAYELSTTHHLVFASQVVSLLAIHIL